MTNTRHSLFNQLRPFTVGFDDMFNHFEHMTNMPQVNFPPYNIVKTGDFTHDIEMALAGFGKDDIEVKYVENTLTVNSVQNDDATVEDPSIIHRGISKRQFSRSFQLADDVVVNGAELKDGLLKVSMEKIVPESKQPRVINIS